MSNHLGDGVAPCDLNGDPGLEKFTYGHWYTIYQGLFSLLFIVPFVYLYIHYSLHKPNSWMLVVVLVLFFFAAIQAWLTKLFVLPLEIRFTKNALLLLNMRREPIRILLSDIQKVTFRRSSAWEPCRFIAEASCRSSIALLRIPSNVKQGPAALAKAFTDHGIEVENITGWSIERVC